MVTGRLAEESNRDPIQEGGMIEMEELPYLGSLVADSRGLKEVDSSGVHGIWCSEETALDKNLTLTTKKKVYRACVFCIES